MMPDKGSNVFDEWAGMNGIQLFTFSRKNNVPLLPEESIKCTHLAP